MTPYLEWGIFANYFFPISTFPPSSTVQCRPLCVCVRAAGDWGSGLGELHVYYWEKMTHSAHYEIKGGLHWRTNLATCLIFVVTLAAIGLERGATMHLYSYFP